MIRGATATALLAVGGLHLAWALGSHAPARDERTLARVVTGAEVMPPRAASAVVGVGLVSAALAAGLPAYDRRGQRQVCRGLALALAGRAFVPAGFLQAGLGLPEPAPAFVRADRRFYRPLCLALATGLVIGTRA